MLKIITGLAGSGKTAAIYAKISEAVKNRIPNRFLIVPEQFSHEAERELCAICGDTMSRYAEVMSFSSLSRAVNSELGGGAKPVLDSAGRLLCMALAVSNCKEKLTVFKEASARPEMQTVFLKAIDAVNSSSLTGENLIEASLEVSGKLSEKLADLGLIYQSYYSVLGQALADPSDSIAALSGKIKDFSRINEKSSVYIDGFTDFTRAETAVIRAILEKGADVSVCLTMDGMYSGDEVFSVSRISALELKKIALELNTAFEEEVTAPEITPDAAYLAKNIFAYKTDKRETSSVQLYSCQSMAEECAFAAAKTAELIKDRNYRLRDTAIAVRGFDRYAPALEAAFDEFGIPLFTARKTPLASRPLPLLITCAYDIILRGWRFDDVITYMGTGLTGLSPDERDALSTYIFKWNLGADAWHRRSPWHQHPDGFGKEFTGETEEYLERINSIRYKIAGPLLKLERDARQAETAHDQALALYRYLEEMGISEILEQKSSEFPEYAQIWDIIISVIEQSSAILKDRKTPPEEYAALFTSALSTYDIGIIPMHADCVSAGDFDRMRRRNIKNLIILGASSDALPASSSGSRLFTDDEQEILAGSSVPIADSPALSMLREYSLIYNCVSLPSDNLIISYPRADSEGAVLSPSVIEDRAKAIFDLEIKEYDKSGGSLLSGKPALKLALSDSSEKALAAKAYFEGTSPLALKSLSVKANMPRGSLSPLSVKKLYGAKPVLSATKAEKFYSCRYQYFADYGLRVRKYEQNRFSASDFGDFAHYVLQETARDVKSLGGFPKVDNQSVERLVKKHISAYERDRLYSFAEKSDRFIYLFKRCERDMMTICLNMAEELRSSKFEPVAFEFDFSGLTDGKARGRVDRIDAWDCGNGIFIRIADYKTGSKSFRLDDIWYGMSMQLIMYLFALTNQNEEAAKMLGLRTADLKCAGIMYVPASNKILSVHADESDDKIAEKRRKALKQSGLVLASDGVPDAWETDNGDTFIPAKREKDGSVSGPHAVSNGQVQDLFRHVSSKLDCMKKSILEGSIDANPYEKGDKMPCEFCSMAGACGFSDGERGEKAVPLPSLSDAEVWEKISGEVKSDE